MRSHPLHHHLHLHPHLSFFIPQNEERERFGLGMKRMMKMKRMAPKTGSA
jgi:hypothetical protein